MPASERFTATYLIETPLPVQRAADVLAGEQSSGTFVAVPGESDALRQKYGARVERIEELDSVDAPSLPGCRADAKCFRRARITISWPLVNVGYNLPTLVSTIGGNLYELSQFSGLKLLDIHLPESFAQHFTGPRFGIDGTRELTNVHKRPIIGTIVKPSVGLTLRETAVLVSLLATAGIDFIKDDELMANPPHSPFHKRVDAVMAVINDLAQRSGKKVMYAFNISGEIDEMRRHYEKVVSAGGTAVMVSLNSIGLVGVKKICDQGALPVHGHRNGWGMLNRHPLLGIDFTAYQKLWRLAGVDHIHVNGIANKFCESDDSVVHSIQACREPLFRTSNHATSAQGTEPDRAGPERAQRAYSILPVISSGQTGLQAPETFRRIKTTDILYLAGGGIMAHPLGPSSGVAAIKQAWQAAVAGTSLEDFARDHIELREQLNKFGNVG